MTSKPTLSSGIELSCQPLEQFKKPLKVLKSLPYKLCLYVTSPAFYMELLLMEILGGPFFRGCVA